MIIRATYELFLDNTSHYNLLMTRINTFEKYLQRNSRFFRSQLESCTNACKIIKGLASRSFSGEQKEKIRIWALEMLETEKKVMVREWLQEKIATL